MKNQVEMEGHCRGLAKLNKFQKKLDMAHHHPNIFLENPSLTWTEHSMSQIVMTNNF